MRRDRTRARRFVLAFTAGALGVLLWQLTLVATQPLVEDLLEAPLEAPLEPSGGPSTSRALFVASALPRALPASASAPRVTWASWTREDSRGEPRSRDPSPEPVASTPPVPPPPRSELELAPDGLPVSGMRCQRVGDEQVCGDCRTDGDCAAGQGCVANRRTRRFECMASDCEEDGSCEPGSVCRPVTTGATGSVIRRCVPEGLRGEGETCDVLAASSASGCHEGLRCVNQVCTLPCSRGTGAGCAPGFVCEDGLEGPGCFPDCRQRGCPEGQHCSRLREDHHQCLASARGDCRETPCAEGERCNLRMSRGHAVFWCARVCNPLQSDSCGSGEVCGVGSPTVSTCFQRCDPHDARACGVGWSCGTVTEDMTVFGCGPDL